MTSVVNSCLYGQVAYHSLSDGKDSTIVFSFGLKQTNKPIKQTLCDSEMFGEKQCSSPDKC